MGAEALGDLVLVVREDEVLAAAMDVELRAEILHAHRRAFEVPARPPASPGTVPARQVGRARLPQPEIGRVLLVGRDLDPGAGDQLEIGRASRRERVCQYG